MLNIISINRFYKLLENGEVETIVTKMWHGSEGYLSTISASSMYKCLAAVSGTPESLSFTVGIDFEKKYKF